jgi:hypothetical protein
MACALRQNADGLSTLKVSHFANPVNEHQQVTPLRLRLKTLFVASEIWLMPKI